MNRVHFVAVVFGLVLTTIGRAEIPYTTRAGLEEVDYAALNPIPGFRLPDSGQVREKTFVHGEDADYQP